MELRCHVIIYKNKAISINGLLNLDIRIKLKKDKVKDFEKDFSSDFVEAYKEYVNEFNTEYVKLLELYPALFYSALGDEFTDDKNNTAFISDYLNNMLLDIVTGNTGKYTKEQLNLYYDFERIFSGDYFEFEDVNDRNKKTENKEGNKFNKVVLDNKTSEVGVPTTYKQVESISYVINTIKGQTKELSKSFSKNQYGLTAKDKDGNSTLIMRYDVFAKKLIGYSLFNYDDDILDEVVKSLKVNNNIKSESFENDVKMILQNLSSIFMISDDLMTKEDKKSSISDIKNKLNEIYELLAKHDISFESVLREVYLAYKFRGNRYLSKELIRDYNSLIIHKVTYDLFENTISIIDEEVLEILKSVENKLANGTNVLKENKETIVKNVKEKLNDRLKEMYGLGSIGYDLKDIDQLSDYVDILIDGVLSIFKSAYEGRNVNEIVNSLELYKNSNDYAAYKFELFRALSNSVAQLLSNYFKSDFDTKLIKNSESYINDILTNTEAEDIQDDDVSEYDNKDEDKGNDEEIIKETIKITPVLEVVLDPIHSLLRLEGKTAEKIDIFAELGSLVKKQIDSKIPALYFEEEKEGNVTTYKFKRLTLNENLSNVIKDIDENVVKEGKKDANVQIEANGIIQKTLLIIFTPSEIKSINEHKDVKNILTKKIGVARYNKDYIMPMMTRVNSVVNVSNITIDKGAYQILGLVYTRPEKLYTFYAQKLNRSSLVKKLTSSILIKLPGASAENDGYRSYNDWVMKDKFMKDANVKTHHPTKRTLMSAAVYNMNYHINGYAELTNVKKEDLTDSYFDVSSTGSIKTVNTKFLNLTDYIFTTLFYLFKRDENGFVKIDVKSRMGKDLNYIVRSLSYRDVNFQYMNLELDYTKMLLDFKESLKEFRDKNPRTVNDIEVLSNNKFFEFSYMIYTDLMNLDTMSLKQLLEKVLENTELNFNDFLTFSKSLANDINKLFENIGLNNEKIVKELKDIIGSKEDIEVRHNRFLKSSFVEKARNYFGMLNLTRYSKSKETDNRKVPIKIGFEHLYDTDKDNKPEGSTYINIVDTFIDSLIKDNIFTTLVAKLLSSNAIVKERGLGFPTGAPTNAVSQYANDPVRIKQKRNYLSHLFEKGKKLGYSKININYIREAGDIKIHKGGPVIYMFSNASLFFSGQDIFTTNPTVKDTFFTLSMGNEDFQYTSLMNSMGYDKNMSFIKIAILDAVDTVKKQIEIYKNKIESGAYSEYDKEYKIIDYYPTIVKAIEEAVSKLFMIPDDYFFNLFIENKGNYMKLANSYLQVLLNPILFNLDIERNFNYHKGKYLLEDKKLNDKIQKHNDIIKFLQYEIFGYKDGDTSETLFNYNFLDSYMTIYTVIVALYEEINARRLFNKYANMGIIPDTLLKKNGGVASYIKEETLFVLNSLLPKTLLDNFKDTGLLKNLLEFIKRYDLNEKNKENREEISFEDFKKDFLNEYSIGSKDYRNILKSVKKSYLSSLHSEEIDNALSIINDLEKRVDEVKKMIKNEQEGYADEYLQLYRDIRDLLNSIAFRRMPVTQIYKFALLDDEDNTKDVLSKKMIAVDYTLPFVQAKYDLDYYFNYGNVSSGYLLDIKRTSNVNVIKEELDKMKKLLEAYGHMSKRLLHFVNNTLQRISLIYTLDLTTDLALVKEEAGDMSKRVTSLTSSGIQFIVSPDIIESDLYITKGVGALINKEGNIPVMVVDDLKIDLSKTELMKKLEEITGDKSITEPYKGGNHTDAHCLVSPHLWYYAAKQYNYATDETLEVMKFINAYDNIYDDVKKGKKSYLDLVRLINDFIDFKDKAYMKGSSKNFIPIIKMQYAGPEHYDKDTYVTNNHKYTWYPIHPLLKVATKLGKLKDEGNLSEKDKFEKLIAEDPVLKFEHDVYSFMMDKGIMYVTSGIKIAKPVRIDENNNVRKINNIYKYEIIKDENSDYDKVVVFFDEVEAEKSIVVSIQPEFLKLNTKNADKIKNHKPANPKFAVLLYDNPNFGSVLYRQFKSVVQNLTSYLIEKQPEMNLPLQIKLRNNLFYIPKRKFTQTGSKENRYSLGTSNILYTGNVFYIPKPKNVKKDVEFNYTKAIKYEYEFFNDIKNTITDNAVIDNNYNFELNEDTYTLELALTKEDAEFIRKNTHINLKFDFGYFEFEIINYEGDDTIEKITNIKDKSKLTEYGQDVKVVTMKIRLRSFLSNTGLENYISGKVEDNEMLLENLKNKRVLVFKDSIIIENKKNKDVKDKPKKPSVKDLNLYERLNFSLLVHDIKKMDGYLPFERLEVSFSPMFYPLLFLKHKDGKIIGNISRLNEMLRDETFVKNNIDKLALVSYRVPLQTGGSYVLFIPERFTGLTMAMSGNAMNNVRTGGDFDNDSLSVHFKAYDLVLKYTKNRREIKVQLSADNMNDYDEISVIVNQIRKLEEKGIPYTLEMTPSKKDIINHSTGYTLANMNKLLDLSILAYSKGLNFKNYYSGVVDSQLSGVIKDLYMLFVGNKMFMDPTTQTTHNANTALITNTIGYLVYFQQLLNYKSIPESDFNILFDEFSTNVINFGEQAGSEDTRTHINPFNIKARSLITRDDFFLLNSENVDKLLMQLITFSVDAVKDQSGAVIVNMMSGPLLNSLGILSELFTRYFEKRNLSKDELRNKPSLASLTLLYPLEVVFNVYRNKNTLLDKNFKIDYNLKGLSKELYQIAVNHDKNVNIDKNKSKNKNKNEKKSEDKSKSIDLTGYSLLDSLLEINRILNRSLNGHDSFVLSNDYDLYNEKKLVSFLRDIRLMMENIMYGRYTESGENFIFNLKVDDKNIVQLTISNEDFVQLLYLLSHTVDRLHSLSDDFRTLLDYEAVKVSNNVKKIKLDLSSMFTFNNSFHLARMMEHLMNIEKSIVDAILVFANQDVLTSSINTLVNNKDRASDIYYKDLRGKDSYLHRSRSSNPFMNVNILIDDKFKRSYLIDKLVFDIADNYLLRKIPQDVLEKLIKIKYYSPDAYGLDFTEQEKEIVKRGNKELAEDLVRGSFFFTKDTFLYGASTKLNKAIDLLSELTGVAKSSKRIEDIESAYTLFSNESVKQFMNSVVEKASPSLLQSITDKGITELLDNDLIYIIFLLGINNPTGDKGLFHNFFMGNFSDTLIGQKKIYFNASSKNLTKLVTTLKKIFSDESYSDIKNKFVNMLVNISYGLGDEGKKLTKEEVERYFDYILNDELFINVTPDGTSGQYDLTRMFYLTGIMSQDEVTKHRNKNKNAGEEIVKEDSDGTYKQLHDKVVNVMWQIVKVGFMNDIDHKESRVMFLIRLIKSDKNKVNLDVYISQHRNNRYYEHGRSVQVFENLLDIFVDYVKANNVDKIKYIESYGNFYTADRSVNFNRYKDIIDTYIKIHDNFTNSADIELKDKLKKMVSELFLAVNLMFSIRKTTETIHKLNDWSSPFNVLKPTALELMVYSILNNILENNNIENYKDEIDRLLGKLGNMNKKLITISNIANDVRNNSVTVKINNGKVEIDFTDFSDYKNKLTVGSQNRKYLFSYKGTLSINPISTTEVDDKNSKLVSDVYFVRQQLRRFLDDMYDVLLESVTNLLDLEDYIKRRLIDSKESTKLKYKNTYLHVDNNGKFNYVVDTYIDENDVKTLEEFIDVSKRVQLLGVIYNHRFTIFDDLIKALTVLDEKFHPELNRFLDMGIFGIDEFYNTVFNLYKNLLLDSQTGYEVKTKVLEKLITKNSSEENFNIDEVVKTENNTARATKEQKTEIEDQEKPCKQ